MKLSWKLVKRFILFIILIIIFFTVIGAFIEIGYFIGYEVRDKRGSRKKVKGFIQKTEVDL